ncbi:hypothetical protein G6F46_011726 [Rhizopus delemar]|uniref:Uncharacterized protein n=3 Tax=Rhizopus TaxID=4842 RepID=I1C5B5_RHIO9|nr:hypothetical protein RO3G_08350 [Rhizopus delemar RA 99-880]KAG1444377.1 hypothetical protein G6F55_012344 [Rhizopus delemar]KAG1533360.1 hypothetical protein G6F51_012653 [Rhizopus arrhizus]KAG1489397.1 hypothetical protein G6F54_011467 [Rhizopus delemar]KAG1499301.1 hypothetical protein G6F53_011549 [Rhizopus delemar]|eukprot:EIE83645.1 hypothetical protein RO3G_08350 [Rhizopus delemar RA 99-880]
MYQVPSILWAKRCLLLSRSVAEGHIGESNPLHPLVAFTMFLTFEARCIMALQWWDDSTLQELYLISKQVVEKLRCAEDEKLRALHIISEVHEKQYGKVLACLLEKPPNLPKMLKYVKDSKECSTRLKRKYDAEADHEDRVVEAVTPIEEPSEITNTSSRIIDL